MTSARAVFIFLLALPFFQARAENSGRPKALSSVECSQLLISHLRENPTDNFLEWKELAEQLSNRKSATLLLQIPLKGFSSPFSDLTHLGLTGDNQVRVLATFGTITDNSYFVVISGNASDLVRAHSVIANRFPNSSLKYQILGSEYSARQFSLPTPQNLLEISNSGSPDIKEFESVALFDSKTSNLAFLFPSSALKGIPGKIAKLLGIRITHANPSESLLNAWRAQQQSSTAKLMISWNNLYLISATAFSELKKLEGREVTLADDDSSNNVADAFLAAIEGQLGHCTEPVCEHSVPEQIIEAIDHQPIEPPPTYAIHPESHSVQFSPEMYGALGTFNAKDLERFLLDYQNMALPVERRQNEYRIIYFKRGESRQAYELIFRRMYSRVTKTDNVLEIIAMERVNDSSIEKNFWKDLRAHLNLNSVVYPLDQELSFGGGYTQGIHVSGNVLTKLLVKHRLSTEIIGEILRGVRIASRSNTKDYVAHVQVEGTQYDLYLTINNDIVHLKTLFKH